MLKINKISFKKIKNSLSLRGEKRRSNLSGFSLIELMVAVVILVMAIFGIFHAYSVGFMGMADARARTVATNYAREAMEDVKNMDFGEIASQSSSITINGVIYNRQVIVPPQESPNIKRVITTVTWNDRNGKQKMVENDMLVHFIETTAGDPTRIMLIANPYNILTEDYDDTSGVYENRSIITAVIKDAKGNTVTAYSGEVTFLIDELNSSGSGNLSTSPVSANKGIASTTFTASSTGNGEVIITASANGLADDSVTIKITDPGEAVKINLTNSVLGVETLFMIPGSESTITATIVDAGGKTVTGADNVITFSVSGPGTLSNKSILEQGIVTIDLTSSTTPGTITVIAVATGLEAGVLDVITGGKISLLASPNIVPAGEKSVITITTKDINGVPINYEGIINLSVELLSGFGTLSSGSVTFYGTTSSETVTFTAVAEGDVNIKAQDLALILEEGDIVILPLTIASFLVPDYIEVYADPSSIKAGSIEDTSTITARVKDAYKITITSYTDPITFTTTAGRFSPIDDTVKSIILYNNNENYNNGVATVELYSPTEPGTANISVTSVYNSSTISGSTKVSFYVAADHIQLVANPQYIEVISGNPNACIITATIKDEYNNTVSIYKGKVKFSIISGDAKFVLTGSALVTVVNGEAQILLQSGSSSGTVRVKATSSYKDKDGVKKDIEGYLNIPVGIDLYLYGAPSYDPSNYSISFDINQREELILEEMQISWDNSDGETLNKIEIKSPYTADPADKVFDGSANPASSGELIDVIDSTLSTGTSNVKIYFDQIMSGKNMEVIFNTNSGNYPVEFTVPAQ